MLTNLQTAKAFLGIPFISDIDDRVISLAINVAAKQILNYLGGDILYKENHIVKLSGNNLQRIYLPNMPIKKINSVKIGSIDVTSEIEVEGINCLYREALFPRITYGIGVENLPSSIQTSKNIEIDYDYGWTAKSKNHPLTRITTIAGHTSEEMRFTSTGIGDLLPTNTPFQIGATLFPSGTGPISIFYSEAIDSNNILVKRSVDIGDYVLFVAGGAGSNVYTQQVESGIDLPDDIEYVCLKIVERIIKFRGTGDNSSKISDFTRSRRDTGFAPKDLTSLTSEEKSILKNYKAVV